MSNPNQSPNQLPPQQPERGPHHISKPVRQGQVTFTNAMLVILAVLELIRFLTGF